MKHCLGGSLLRKHKSTRRLAAPVKNELQLEDWETELRQGLDWQRRVADALPGYAEAVACAFEQLACAHQALDEGCIGGVGEDINAMAKSLLRGLQEAHAATRAMAEKMRIPLETHRATLSACADDLARADVAVNEALRYEDKVNSLASDDEENPVSPKAEAKVERNRAKLQQATNVASVAQTRAHDSLHSCIARKGILCRIAREVVQCTAGVISGAALRLATPFNADASPSQSLVPSNCPDNSAGHGHQEDLNGHNSDSTATKATKFTVTACGEKRATGTWAPRGEVNGRPKYTRVRDHHAVIYWNSSGEWRMYFKDREGTPTLYRSRLKLQAAPLAGWEAVRGSEPAPQIATEEDEDEPLEGGHKTVPDDDAASDPSGVGSEQGGDGAGGDGNMCEAGPRKLLQALRSACLNGVVPFAGARQGRLASGSQQWTG
mmetsp:Transcript_101119/g.286618  ORF Transcript_101119/g.286618 Transcript_101119/m.286618 type:complete len:436 (+) Transcript_101119:115-1422(+)